MAGTCTRAVMLSALAGFAAADATPYERMAPLEQYLMPPGSEIALARSAAPPRSPTRPQSSLSIRRLPDCRPRTNDSPVSWRGRGCRRRKPRFLESEDEDRFATT